MPGPYRYKSQTQQSPILGKNIVDSGDLWGSVRGKLCRGTANVLRSYSFGLLTLREFSSLHKTAWLNTTLFLLWMIGTPRVVRQAVLCYCLPWRAQQHPSAQRTHQLEPIPSQDKQGSRSLSPRTNWNLSTWVSVPSTCCSSCLCRSALLCSRAQALSHPQARILTKPRIGLTEAVTKLRNASSETATDTWLLAGLLEATPWQLASYCPA